jgi:hypothetical protein
MDHQAPTGSPAELEVARRVRAAGLAAGETLRLTAGDITSGADARSHNRGGGAGVGGFIGRLASPRTAVILGVAAAVIIGVAVPVALRASRGNGNLQVAGPAGKNLSRWRLLELPSAGGQGTGSAFGVVNPATGLSYPTEIPADAPGWGWTVTGDQVVALEYFNGVTLGPVPNVPDGPAVAFQPGTPPAHLSLGTAFEGFAGVQPGSYWLAHRASNSSTSCSIVEVNVEGKVLLDPKSFGCFSIVGAVDGGLLVSDFKDNGVVVRFREWDPVTGRFIRKFSGRLLTYNDRYVITAGRALPSPTSPGPLKLHEIDLSTGRTVALTLVAPRGMVFDGQPTISPSGREIAALLVPSGNAQHPGDTGGWLAAFGPGGGRAASMAPLSFWNPGVYAWSPDGEYLFIPGTKGPPNCPGEPMDVNVVAFGKPGSPIDVGLKVITLTFPSVNFQSEIGFVVVPASAILSRTTGPPPSTSSTTTTFSVVCRIGMSPSTTQPAGGAVTTTVPGGGGSTSSLSRTSPSDGAATSSTSTSVGSPGG